MIRGSLAWLLAPVDPSVFVAEHFERKPLHVRGDARRYRGLPTLAEVDRAITGRALRYPDVRMAREGEKLAPASFTRADGAADPILVAARLAEGATLVLNGVEAWSPVVARLCAVLGRRVRGSSWANLYLTPPRSHGFAPHTDDTDVFVLQLRGEKRWTLHAPPTALPPLGPISKRFDDADATAETIVLRPGDLLYVPRGQAHAAATGEHDSMHLTVAIAPATWATVLHAALDELAARDERLRHAVPFGAFGAPETARDDFAAMLRTLAERADVKRSLARVHAEAARQREPIAPGHIAASFDREPVTVDTVVARRPAQDVALRSSRDAIELSLSGRTISLPRHTRAAVRYALSHKRFRVADLPDDLDDAGKVVLVKRLVREGILRVRREASPTKTEDG